MRDNVKGGALTETTFLIMLAVYKPRHGYGINKLIEEQTNGRVSLGAGTLYKALSALLSKNWIEPCGEAGTKKDYVITEAGKRIVESEKVRLKKVVDIAEALTEGEHT